MPLLRNHFARLTVGVLFVGTLFGCMGFPRREAPKAPKASQLTSRGARPAPELRIPVTRPQPPLPPAPVTSPPPARAAAPVPPTTNLQTAAPPAAAKDDLAQMRRLFENAAKENARMSSYIVRLTRRERIKGKLQPEETLLFKYRKEPLSVYFKWLGDSGKGREVTYVEGRYEGKIHTKVAAGDVPFVRAGKVLSFSPDSALIRANSRHDIREAGVGTVIGKLGALVEGMERGNPSKGTLKYLGRQNRPGFAQPLECIHVTIPPKVERGLPLGGFRWCYLDPQSHLPTLIITQDERRNLVESYRYDRFQYPVMLDDDDFNPTVLFGNPRAGD